MTLFLTPVLYCVDVVESNKYLKGIEKQNKKKIKIMYGFIYFNYPFALTLT